MRTFALTVYFFLSVVGIYAQEKLDIQKHADCNTRLSVSINKTIGPTTAPKGHGSELEFKGNQLSNIHFIQKENNTVWYQFDIQNKGTLSFEIEPLDSLDDYDFSLYKYTDDSFCEAVKNKGILPIRTNFSRNKLEIGGRTGLKITAEKEFVAAGINPAYSKAIKVDKNEKYVLLVNNVYNNGDGHSIKFDCVKTEIDTTPARKVVVIKKKNNRYPDSSKISITGEVVTEEGERLADAEVTVTNVRTGEIIVTTQTDTLGNYNLDFDIHRSQLSDNIHLEIFKEGYFFQDTLMQAYDMAYQMKKVKIKTKIKKIKEGDSFVVKNILFHGNSARPLPNALPSIKALYKMMKRNKTLKIRIEGHTNGCGNGPGFSMKLSNSRAKTVEGYLLENGIHANRMTAKGYGCSRMLFSNPGGRYAHLNRRVEIKVLGL